MTMKAHTYYIIFGRPPIGGKLPHPPPLAAPQTSTDIIVYIYLHLKLHYGFHCYSADLPVAVSPSIVMTVFVWVGYMGPSV